MSGDVETARVSLRLKGRLASWYNNLENKTYHTEESYRLYIALTGVGLDNYSLEGEDLDENDLMKLLGKSDLS